MQNPQPFFEFAAFGTPRPQGSMTLTRHPSGATSARYGKHVYAWRTTVTDFLMMQAASSPFEKRRTEPVGVDLHFMLARPKHHFRTGKFAGELKAGVPDRPTTSPDLDKLVRAVLDSITDSGCVWTDDAQVATLSASKMYTPIGDDDAGPGVYVRLYEETRRYL